MSTSLSPQAFQLPEGPAGEVTDLVSRAQASGLVERGTLEWEGAHLAFDVLVPSGAQAPRRVLALVNGYQRTRLDFRAFRKRLAVLSPHIVTVSLDNRGCGDTKLFDLAHHPLTLERLARDAGALARGVSHALSNASTIVTSSNASGVGTRTPFSVLGISMGGMVAQILAAHCPDVASCVLVSTTAGGAGRIWPDHVDPMERRAFRAWPTDEAGMRRKMVRYFGARFLERSPLLVDMMVKNMLKAQNEARQEALAAGSGAPEGGARDGSRLQFEASSTFDGTELLAHIPCPTLVVTGDEDFIIPKENASFLHARLPNARLVEYAGAGHLLLVEEPEAFVVDVANFLG